MNLSRQAIARVTTVYFAGVNAGAAGLFYYDKKCAEAKQWRVPEATLCASAAAGGWIGGMWAMQRFRHKTAKKSFQEKFYAATAANVAGVGLGGVAAGNPNLRRKILRISCGGKRPW